jgi:ATP-dependent DNA ligase
MWMQADEVGRPFHRDGWIYEEKYDGWRIIAYKDGTAVRLISRAGKEHSRRRFSELAAAIRALPPATLILDGEVAIFDDKLISRFEWFRKRPEDVASTPPIYMAFDCLWEADAVGSRRANPPRSPGWPSCLVERRALGLSAGNARVSLEPDW